MQRPDLSFSKVKFFSAVDLDFKSMPFQKNSVPIKLSFKNEAETFSGIEN